MSGVPDSSPSSVAKKKIEIKLNKMLAVMLFTITVD